MTILGNCKHGTLPHPLIYILSVEPLHQTIWSIWFAQSEIFTIWLFIEKVSWPLLSPISPDVPQYLASYSNKSCFLGSQWLLVLILLPGAGFSTLLCLAKSVSPLRRNRLSLTECSSPCEEWTESSSQVPIDSCTPGTSHTALLILIIYICATPNKIPDCWE